MATELPKAVALMHEVEAELKKLKPKRALPHAQGALRHLQRAEAAFLEAQVAQNSQSGGGTASAEDLEELFQLELDKLRNQYETVQRGQQQASQAQAERDELLQKLKQLAQRQQRENERAARRQAQQNGGGGGGGGRQQALAEQAEELLRQLEKLTRERQTPELQTLQRQLADAAESMRRAAAGNPSERASAGQDALEQLRQARQSLQRNRGSELRQQLADARSRGERLAEQQRRLAEQVRSLRPSQDDGRQGAQQNGQQSSGQQSSGQQSGQQADAGQQSGQQSGQQGGQQSGQQAGAGQQSSGQQSGQQASAGQQSSGQQSGQQAGAGQQSGQQAPSDQAGGSQRQQTEGDERQMSGVEDSAEDGDAAELQRQLRAELRAGKQNLTAEVRDIEQRLRELAREARAEQPGAARRLQLAADDLRNRRVDAKIRQSQTAIDNDALDYARALEAQIETDLARLNRGLEGAAEELGESRQQRLGRTLEDLQQLTLGLESLRRRAGQTANAEAGGEQAQNNGAGSEQQQQQEGNTSSGQSGGQTAGGRNAGSVASGGDGGLDVDGRYGGYDGFTGRQIARELDIRQGELRALTETLRREQLDDQGLAKIRQRLQALEQGVVAGDPRSLEALAREVIERLKELEFGLRRELDGDDSERRLTVSEGGPVPDRYRLLIEEYYRSLSRTTPAGG